MADKDMTEKTLEAYNDVFADIVNVLLFDGKQVIHEDELEDETPRSIYKADGELHEQERDVAKFWKNCGVRIALYGLENQTNIDVDIPFRVISYDGAAYRAQLLDEKPERYPVVTLVLYFGEKRWNKPLSLLDRLSVPEELKPYVNDYKINLFEISYLTDEQLQKFSSDFRVVAEYFVQTRRDKDYHPSDITLKHVHEVLQMMAAVTQDHRFEDTMNEFNGREVPSKMSEYLDKIISIGEARGMEHGIECGIERGIAEERARSEAAMAAKDREIAELKAQLEKLRA